jgi:hypothetical protein
VDKCWLDRLEAAICHPGRSHRIVVAAFLMGLLSMVPFVLAVMFAAEFLDRAEMWMSARTPE